MITPQSPEEEISRALLDESLNSSRNSEKFHRSSINDLSQEIKFISPEKPQKRKKKGIFSSIYRCVKCIYPDVSPKENVEMSPVEKFIKKRRFPFKFFFDVSILIASFFFIINLTQFRNPFMKNQRDSFAILFLKNGFETSADAVDGIPKSYFDSVDDILAHMVGMAKTYYSFQKISPDTYVFDSKEDNTGSYREKNTIRLKTRFMRQNPRGLFSYKQRTPGKDPAYKIANFENYPMSSYLEYGWFGWDIQETEEFIEMPETPAEKAKDASYLGNFFKECLESNTYKRDAFDRLISAQFLMPFKAIDTSEKNYFPLCSRWDVTLTLDNDVKSGSLPLKIQFREYDCERSPYPVIYALVLRRASLYAIFLIAMNPISFLLILKSIISKSLAYLKLHRKHPEIYPYSKYTTHVPIFWLLATLLRDLLIFLAGILYFFKFEPYFLTGTLGDAFYTFAKTLNIFLYDMLTWFLSFGAFLSFVCIMQYLKYFPKFYVTVLGLFNGIKHILKVIIGQLPLFIGFILTGTLWFGSYAVYFQTIGQTFVTIFAAALGDVLHDILDQIYGFHDFYRILSRIYIYCVVATYVLGVFNTFLLTMELAYFAVVNPDEGHEQEEEKQKEKEEEEDEKKKQKEKEEEKKRKEEHEQKHREEREKQEQERIEKEKKEKERIEKAKRKAKEISILSRGSLDVSRMKMENGQQSQLFGSFSKRGINMVPRASLDFSGKGKFSFQKLKNEIELQNGMNIAQSFNPNGMNIAQSFNPNGMNVAQSFNPNGMNIAQSFNPNANNAQNINNVSASYSSVSMNINIPKPKDIQSGGASISESFASANSSYLRENQPGNLAVHLNNINSNFFGPSDKNTLSPKMSMEGTYTERSSFENFSPSESHSGRLSADYSQYSQSSNANSYIDANSEFLNMNSPEEELENQFNVLQFEELDPENPDLEDFEFDEFINTFYNTQHIMDDDNEEIDEEGEKKTLKNEEIFAKRIEKIEKMRIKSEKFNGLVKLLFRKWRISLLAGLSQERIAMLLELQRAGTKLIKSE